MVVFSKLKAWAALLCCAVVVGCGGGGQSGTPFLTDGSNTGTGTTAVSSLQVKVTPTSVDTSGTRAVVATVTALSGGGQGIAGVPITLTVNNNGTYSYTGATGGTTASDGTVTASVTIGNDSTPRQITVTANVTGGTASGTATVEVTASSTQAADLILTASPATMQNSVSNVSTITVTAVDGNRNALPNIPVTLTVDNGATISPSGTVTSAGGALSGALRIGSDQSNRTIKVTARSGSVVRVVDVQVIGTTLTGSGLSNSVGIGTTNPIVYVLADNTGAKLANYPITVSATGLPTRTGTTDSFGEYIYSFSPTIAGQATITATAGGMTDTKTIAVAGVVVIDPVTAAVNSSSVRASPSVILVNPVAGELNNKTEIRALFLGANNAPIPNVRVWFDLDGDRQSVGGTLDSKLGGRVLYSDANGVARTTYAPGARFSPKDGLTVRACWWVNDNFSIPAEGGACANSTTTTLTVVSDSLSVSIGTNGLLGSGRDNLTYIQKFAVQVVDGAGVAKSGAKVTPSIDLLQYFKGEWKAGTDRWVRGGKGNRYPALYPNNLAVPLPRPLDNDSADWMPDTVVSEHASVCDNEDLNRNGVSEDYLDSRQNDVVPEDQNGSLNLTAGRPALEPRKADVSVSLDGADTTDANGIVVVRIEYPKNLGSWVSYNLVVSASGIAGTEGRANFSSRLLVDAEAANNVKASPPFQYSPYGMESSPTFPRRNAEGQSGWICTNPY